MGLTRTLIVAGAGAALAYLLDPVSGKERRRRLRERLEQRTQGGAEIVHTDTQAAPTIVVKPPREAGLSGTPGDQQPAPKRPVS